jgi:hypothetical protein
MAIQERIRPIAILRPLHRVCDATRQGVTVDKGELLAEKLLPRIRGNRFHLNHFANDAVSICRLMHWYQVKKPKP